MTPNCIFVPTPKPVIDTILSKYPVKDKIIYEPGCGDGDFLKACLLENAGYVYGTEPDSDRKCHKMNRLHNCSIFYNKHEDLPVGRIRNLDLVYCFLMHGMAEGMLEMLARQTDKFDVICLNYPIPYWKNEVLECKPNLTMKLEGGYPPYALIYTYEMNKGILTPKNILK